MKWQKRPTFIEAWPLYDPSIEYAIFVDENGDASLDHLIKAKTGEVTLDENNRHFSLTACRIHRDSHVTIKNNVLSLKKRYWKDGLYQYKRAIKRICFHSREIRYEKEAFSRKVISYDAFVSDLSDFMNTSEYRIISAHVDKYNHVMKYAQPINPYILCIDFLFERIALDLKDQEKRCIVIFEARGKVEDRVVLNHAVSILENGTSQVRADQLSMIAGVYFNPKWCRAANDQKSYFGLEIADLAAYPIYRYLAYQKHGRDFETIKSKISGFPNAIDGRGLKSFP